MEIILNLYKISITITIMCDFLIVVVDILHLYGVSIAAVWKSHKR